MVVRGLSKSFGATLALQDFAFNARYGEVHALVGGNGSGKSTFIKVLAGVHRADAGTLRVDETEYDLVHYTPDQGRAAGLRFVHQDLGIFGMQTVAENLAIGHGFEHTRSGRIRWGYTKARAREMLARFNLDVDPGRLANELSMPQHAVLAIARSLQDFDEGDRGVLVMDEPTAALPAQEVHILLDTLRRLAAEGHAIIFVTHRLEEVRQVADRVTAVRDARAAGTVDTAFMSDADAVELILGRQLKRADSLVEASRASMPVLRARSISGGPIRGVDLEVGAGEIVGVAGLLGSGRSELLRLLYGALPMSAGEVEFDGKAVSRLSPREMRRRGAGLVPEDRLQDAIFGGSSVRENMTAGKVGQFFDRLHLSRMAEMRAVGEDVSRYSVKTVSTETLIEGLSGGNQQKVVIGRWLRNRPKLLLLDEPTQGIDIGAREDIYALINEAASEGSGFLMVSSEFEELVRLCNRVLILAHGEIVAERKRPLNSHDLLERALEATMTGAS
jgi:ribose transport system ATP-binding protein